MRKIITQKPVKKGAVAVVEDVTWLNQVREVRHPIDMSHPLIVRSTDLQTGPPPPQPSVPFPEKHPYCELNFNLEGRSIQFIGAEKVERNTGDLMLMGPGMPHYATRLSYPQRTVTVHFLPILLFEMGPEGDGARVLARFTASQKIDNRVVCPPTKLSHELAWLFQQMMVEFTNRDIGSEFRLRALLMEILVALLRWEESTGIVFTKTPISVHWLQVEKTLRYLHQYYAEPLYIEQIAASVGLGVSRLQVIFREAIGMSCIHYLRALRISHAKALLCEPEARVTEVALQVGFETLSHFNTSFRSLIGMSPTEYMHSHQQNRN